jgi:lipocalin
MPGRIESIEPTLRRSRSELMNKNTPDSILKVRFAPAFLSFIPQAWGDYQIIALSPDYTHALVGDPGREYLWVTFRSPRMDEATHDRLLKEARRRVLTSAGCRTRDSPEFDFSEYRGKRFV